MNGRQLDPIRLWECPSCGYRKQTTEPGVITPMHPCGDHGGIDVPLQQADRHGIIGPTQTIEVVEREDWIGAEQVQHGGASAVHSKRADGSYDTVVFAPTARVQINTEE